MNGSLYGFNGRNLCRDIMKVLYIYLTIKIRLPKWDCVRLTGELLAVSTQQLTNQSNNPSDRWLDIFMTERYM